MRCGYCYKEVEDIDKTQFCALCGSPTRHEGDSMFSKGLAMFCVDQPNYASVVNHCKSALTLGLSPFVETECRVMLGTSCMRKSILDHRTAPWEEILNSSDHQEGIHQIETALKMNREYNFDIFEKTGAGYFYMADLVMSYRRISILLSGKKGIDEAIGYIQQKLSQFKYLSSSPAAPMYVTLGDFLMRTNKIEEAKNAFIEATRSDLPENGHPYYEDHVASIKTAESGIEVIRSGITPYHQL